jgi:hypothetical protein
MADVSEMDQSDESANSAYDEEIHIIERVDIYDSSDRKNHVVLEFTRGTLFFKEGRLVRHETRKSKTEIELTSPRFRRADLW